MTLTEIKLLQQFLVEVCKTPAMQQRLANAMRDAVYEIEMKNSAPPASSEMRVACVALDGTTLTVPVDQLADTFGSEDEQHTYTLTFKTMTRTEFEALGEFNGF